MVSREHVSTFFQGEGVVRKSIQRCISVSTQYGRDHPSFQRVTSATKKVHVAGHPFLWALEEIFRRAPHLAVLQVIPSKEGWITRGRYKKICATHNVRVVIACHQRKQLGEAYRPSRSYRRKRQTFLRLPAKAKKEFEELLAIGYLEAKVTARYFCLEGEPYLSERLIAAEFQLRGHDRDASLYVHAVRHYLFPHARVSRSAKAHARMIRRRVKIHRGEISLPKLKDPPDLSLPSNLRKNRISVYQNLLRAWEDGRVDQLLQGHKEWYRVLVLRYGLNGKGTPTHRSFRTVAKVLQCSGMHVLDVERRALQALKISLNGSNEEGH